MKALDTMLTNVLFHINNIKDKQFVLDQFTVIETIRIIYLGRCVQIGMDPKIIKTEQI